MPPRRNRTRVSRVSLSSSNALLADAASSHRNGTPGGDARIRPYLGTPTYASQSGRATAFP